MFMNFKVTPENRVHLKTILDRLAEFDPDRDRTSASMDLIACHNGGCPLDFEAMVACEDFGQVAHDIAGIGRFLDRETGELAGFFHPRFTLRERPVVCTIKRGSVTVRRGGEMILLDSRAFESREGQRVMVRPDLTVWTPQGRKYLGDAYIVRPVSLH